jgi:hypothetical protein
MHRWIWDLHYAPPRSLQRGFPISAVPGDTPQEPAGPIAAPGTYQVRLSIGARQWHVPLTLLPDPRLTMSSQDYAALFASTHELAETFDESSAALLECKSLRAQLEKLKPKLDAPLNEQVHTLDMHIEELMGSAENKAPPESESADHVAPAVRGLERLNEDVATLYGQINDVDALPTTVQKVEARRARADWQTQEQRWRQLRETEVPQLNRTLAKARLPPLIPDAEPPRDLNFAYED